MRKTLRWLATQWKYRREVRVWGWADPDHDAQAEDLRRYVERSFTEEPSDQVKAMLSGAVDRLRDPLTVDTPEAIRARLESSDE